MTAVPLELRDLTVAFGGNVVLKDVSIAFGNGFNGLIGPNGAGKTTCFNVVSGYVRPSGGEVELFGEPLRERSQARVAGHGIGRTFQSPRLVLDLTVLENTLLGLHQRYRSGHLRELLGLGGARREEREGRERARELLNAFGLGARAEDLAGNLPLGSQKLVEVARALMAAPKVVLLDEPAAGLGATDVDVMLRGLSAIVDEGSLCVVIIEHDLQLVMDLCPFLAVLHNGAIIASGAPADVVANPTVVEAYLGASVAADV